MDGKTQPAYLVDAYSDPAVVKVVGRASFQNCGPLKDFFSQTAAAGKRRFVLDFSKCTGMDSTFLGVLVGAALKLRKFDPPGALTLVRLGQRNLELVRNLGLHRLVTVEADASQLSFDPVRAQGLPAAAAATEVESAKLVLEAHENLVAADEANAARFQDVIAFLKNRVDQG